MPRRKQTLRERFWSKVAVPVENGEIDHECCWPWKSRSTVRGRGLITIGNKSYYAPRVAWVLCRGPIPKGLGVLHKCDNPPCVNPRHLFLGTQKDNVDDMRAKGRGNYKGAPRLYGPELRAEAVRLRATGLPFRDIANEIGVSVMTARKWALEGEDPTYAHT